MERLIFLRPIFRNYTYTMRRGLAKGLKRQGGMSFIPQWSKSSCKENQFLQQLNLTNKIVFDIGAFEGMFTLFFAQAVGSAGHVFTFEPNPINYERVLTNIALNNFKNIKVFNTALGDATEKLTLMFSSFEAGSGSLHNEVQTKFTDVDKPQTTQVTVKTLDSQMVAHNLPIPDLIKIDVEGFEPKVLNGMKSLLTKARPAFFIELHGFMMTDDRASYWEKIVDPLLELGYSITHVETEQTISASMINPPTSGHLYCSESST